MIKLTCRRKRLNVRFAGDQVFSAHEANQWGWRTSTLFSPPRRAFGATKHVFCLNASRLSVFDTKGNLKRNIDLVSPSTPGSEAYPSYAHSHYFGPSVSAGLMSKSATVVIGHKGLISFYPIKQVG
jgi:hypothetical protein